MRHVVIENGVVTNAVEAPEGYQIDGQTVVQSDTASIGWTYDGATFTAPPIPPPSIADLTVYAKGAQTRVLAAGKSFVVSDGKSVLCDGTAATRADLAMLALYAQANPDGSKTWVDNNGVTTVLQSSELITLASEVGNWIADTYPSLANVVSQIANKTVTTKAEIDAYSM